MLVDSASFATMMTPRRIRDTVGVASLETMLASLRRRWDAYQKLREIREGVLNVGPVVVSEAKDDLFFDVEPSDTYEAIKLAVGRDLVWSTKKKTVDYERTIERWCQMLEHDRVEASWVERVHANDLDTPEFGDFKITLMEYLISCQRKGNTYFRQSGFEAVRPSS